MQTESPSMFQRIDNATMRIVSLGAGVQSTVLALMAAKGEIEMPDAAIFADTGWEPQAIYDHLDWLETELPFPVYRVQLRDIRQHSLDTLKDDKYRYSLPFFFGDEGDNKAGMAARQCTAEFKIKPIQKKVRELLGLNKGDRVPKTTTIENWMGITRDEIFRVKPSRIKYMPSRWPLIEKNMTRHDCNLWFNENYPDRPPLEKSSCIGCPYKSDAQWRDMKNNDPVAWIDVVGFDQALREGDRHAFGQKAPVYVHQSLKPLDEVDFRDATDHGQMEMFSAEECEGFCGV